MKGPLRILHVAPAYFPAVRYGGPIYSVHGLAAASAALGHHVDVYTTNADGPGRLDVPTDRPVDVNGVNVRYFALSWPARLVRAPGMADAAAWTLPDYDVVHIHSLFLWPTMRMARLCERLAVPYIVSPRGMLVKSLFEQRSGFVKSLWMRLFDRRTLERAAAVHFTAAAEAREAASFGYALPPSIIIPNAVAMDGGTTAPDDGPNSVSRLLADFGPFLLSLGRINWKKNLTALVAAMRELPDHRLVIAGNDEDGETPQLRAAITDAGLADRVRLIVRPVLGAEKQWLYANCQAFVLPSLSENFGNVVVEAMAAGKAVVVTHGCGVAEHVLAASAGHVCDSEPHALAQAIAATTADDVRLAQMGAAARRYVEQHLTWPSVATSMVDAYYHVTGRAHA